MGQIHVVNLSQQTSKSTLKFCTRNHYKLTLQRAQVKQPVQKVGQRENYPVRWREKERKKENTVLRKLNTSTQICDKVTNISTQLTL